ncbi:MAG: ABC transporter ATP-binding protein [Lachnospiraceae bacterium]|nr:ABC transporter ATP-binding protein [Lachnospiraceae bacterium]
MGSIDYIQTIVKLLFWIVEGIGCLMIFKKCNVEGKWAFVPVAREYYLSRCADREKDGRKYAILVGLEIILRIPFEFSPQDSIQKGIIAIFVIIIALTEYLYKLRIFYGLCMVFEKRKRWMFAWFFAESITAVIWGYSDKFMPKKLVEKIDLDAGARLSGAKAESIEKGLTVNINERTTIDFFKRKYLLKDIHLNIPEGHMVLLLGGSGAGKTTFVNAVTGYEKADASILLNNNDIYTQYSRMKYDVGFVPQLDLMRGNDTVLRTLSDAATLRLPSGVTLAKRKKRVNDVLEEFGLAAIRNSLVEKLSGGQRKRLSIAMEFISDPSLFILDEPDSGLDGVVARGLFEKLRSIADSGKIVVVITHTPDRVIDLFDDVIVLAKDASLTGRLAYYGPVKEAYDFFGKDSLEDILLSINQKEEGGEGRADEFVEKYADTMAEAERKAG